VRREGAAVAAKPLRSEYVTGNYFSTLGVNAFGGRVFSPSDDKPSAPPVIVISHQAWQTETMEPIPQSWVLLSLLKDILSP
jgi:hypothetical protein